MAISTFRFNSIFLLHWKEVWQPQSLDLLTLTWLKAKTTIPQNSIHTEKTICIKTFPDSVHRENSHWFSRTFSERINSKIMAYAARWLIISDKMEEQFLFCIALTMCYPESSLLCRQQSIKLCSSLVILVRMLNYFIRGKLFIQRHPFYQNKYILLYKYGKENENFLK